MKESGFIKSLNRVRLHLFCLAKTRHFFWHLKGVIREIIPK